MTISLEKKNCDSKQIAELRAHTQHGQAVIEYTLLMVVVLIVLGLFFQLSSGFQEFATGYFGPGGYLECLIKSSELPTTLGTGSAGEKTTETCAGSFQEFKLGQAKKQSFKTAPPASSQPNLSPMPSMASATSPSSSNGTDSSLNLSSAPSGGSAGLSESENGGGRSSLGRVGEGGGYDPRSRNVPVGDGDLGKTANSNSSSRQKVSLSRADHIDKNDEGGGRRRLVSADGQMTASQKEDNLRKDRIPASQNEIANPGRKVALLDSKKNGALQDDDPWTIGNFIKFLLIAAIVIALVVFFGGQVLQYSKGQD